MITLSAAEAAEVARWALRGRVALKRDGVEPDPAGAAGVEKLLQLSRSRSDVGAATPARARSELLGVCQVAELVGVSVRRVQQLAASGALGRRVGGRYVFTEKEIERYGTSRREGGGARQVAA